MDVGLYGKLPSHGDFLRRRVDNEFIGVWDAWLQECIAASRAQLGDDWLEVYLTSPAWRFVCDVGVFGQRAYAGIMVPSVDRVGRYFPLTLVWAIPETATPFAVVRIAARWFELTEQLIVEILAAEKIDFEEFDRRLVLLNDELTAAAWNEPLVLDRDQATAVTGDNALAWKIPLASPASCSALAEQLLYARLQATHDPLVLLWTEGSAVIEPNCLMLRGLPTPDAFTALLDGAWKNRGWHSVAAQVSAAPHADTLVSGTELLSYRSAAISHVGKVRSTNQDAFLERAEIGLWVVADGMGGLQEGDLASRMVCDALANLVPSQTLLQTVSDAQARLQEVNAYLYKAATRPNNPVQSGTTVVVLLVRGDQCAILWVGDSRVYRLRAGQLSQLTKDHSWSQIALESELDSGLADDVLDSNVITRAIGGDEELAIDTLFDKVRAGDRFLLCSDGLTRPVSDASIATLLSQGDVTSATQALLDRALASGAPDNVTALVVEATVSPKTY